MRSLSGGAVWRGIVLVFEEKSSPGCAVWSCFEVTGSSMNGTESFKDWIFTKLFSVRASCAMPIAAGLSFEFNASFLFIADKFFGGSAGFCFAAGRAVMTDFEFSAGGCWSLNNRLDDVDISFCLKFNTFFTNIGQTNWQYMDMSSLSITA